MPRYTATDIDQANVSGAINYAVWLVDTYGESYARGQLRDAFLDPPSGLISQVMTEANRRIAAGERMEALAYGETLSDRSVPVNRLLPEGCDYRYRVQLTWADPDSGTRREFTSWVCSGAKLDLEAAKAEALDVAIGAGNDSVPTVGSIGRVAEADVVATVISVERRG